MKSKKAQLGLDSFVPGPVMCGSVSFHDNNLPPTLRCPIIFIHASIYLFFPPIVQKTQKHEISCTGLLILFMF